LLKQTLVRLSVGVKLTLEQTWVSSGALWHGVEAFLSHWSVGATEHNDTFSA